MPPTRYFRFIHNTYQHIYSSGWFGCVFFGLIKFILLIFVFLIMIYFYFIFLLSWANNVTGQTQNTGH
jgi:uncharacterized membrane protein